jgi:hypothetical protein
MMAHPLALALVVLAGAGTTADGASVWAQNPFKSWDSVQDRLYTFCSNSSGALSEEAVAKIAKGKIMIHGMEVPHGRCRRKRRLFQPHLKPDTSSFH